MKTLLLIAAASNTVIALAILIIIILVVFGFILMKLSNQIKKNSDQVKKNTDDLKFGGKVDGWVHNVELYCRSLDQDVGKLEQKERSTENKDL